jgi:DNA-binding transcriptional LysR family regulator
MDTRFLESFIAIVDCGAMAEAARRLNLTPAGVAQQIRALEKDLGVDMLFRAGRTVRPTKAALAVLGQARSFIREVRDLKLVANTGELSGELRIGAMQTSLPGLVPDILSALVKAYPRIKIHIIRDASAGLYPRVLSGEIDAAVTSEPPFAIPKTLAWHVLREEPFVVLTPMSLPSRDPHAILEREPFIRLDRSVYAGRLIDRYLRKAGIRPKELFELDGLEAIAVMVDRGLGVSLLPDWPPPWPAGLRLRKLPLPDRSFKRRTGLLFSRASLRIGLINAFLEQAQSALGRTRSGSALRMRA